MNLKQAKWIGCRDYTGSPMFEKKLIIEKMPDSAVMEISGLGFYVLSVNGKRVGDALLQPAFSTYDKTVYYNVLDLKDYLSEGENVFRVELGNGWYNEEQANAWRFEQATWRDKPKFICELKLDGETALVSDRSWKCGSSQRSFNSLRCGETIDHRIVPVLDRDASVVLPPMGDLKEQTIPPIRVRRRIEPKEVLWHHEGVRTYDFGVNLSGDVEIRARGSRGAKITVIMCEQIMDDGGAVMERIGEHVYSKRFQEDEFILSGEGEEVFSGEFSYKGFRYARVWYSGEVEILDVCARQFHTDLPAAGGITTDYAPVQQLHDACVQSTLTNFHHMPTDCPHREKNGWTGDAQLSCEQMLFNLDMFPAYDKWLDDIADCQKPCGMIPAIAPTSLWGYKECSGISWDLALFELPWQMYRYSGEVRWLEKWYGNMRRYIDYMEATAVDHVSVIGLDDWVPDERTHAIPRNALLTGCAYRAATIYLEAARLLEKKEDISRAEHLKSDIKEAFEKNFCGSDYGSSTYLGMVLMYGLAKDPQAAAARLNEVIIGENYHITGGIFGSKYILNALTENGYFDTAWKIADNEEAPGWRFMLTRTGGSTLGEGWRGGSSRNHHMFSEIGAWFYKALAGINITEPGFRQVDIVPHIPETVRTFSAWHDTPCGRLIVGWDENELTVTVPEGVKAHLVFDGIEKDISAQTIKIRRK